MTSSRWGSRVLVMLMLVAGIFLFSAHPASAATGAVNEGQPTDQCVASQDLRATNTGAPGSSGGSGQTDLLPIDRWGNAATSFHTRLNTGRLGLDSLPQQATRNAIAPLGLSIGNGIWQFATGMVKFANNFDVLTKMGCTADRTAYSLGDGINRGLLGFIAAIAIFAALWRARSGQSPVKDLTKIGAVLCVFALLLNGASHTSSDGTIGSGSPAWFAIETSNVASGVMAPIVSGMVAASPGAVGIATTGGKNAYALGCNDYVTALHDMYAAQHSDAAMPMVLSAMWEQSGLAIWAASQFGQKNNYGAYVYCHMLDREVGVPIAEQSAVLRKSWNDGAVSTEGAGPVAGPILVGQDSAMADSVYVFLAACRFDGTSWHRSQGWADISGPNKVTPYACQSAWQSGTAKATDKAPEPADDSGDSGSDSGGGSSIVDTIWSIGMGAIASTPPGAILAVGGAAVSSVQSSLSTSDHGPGGPFDWGQSQSSIDSATANPNSAGVADYMNNLHGYAIGGAMTLSVIYVIVALLMLLTFGLLALSIIVAKLASLVMIIMVFLVLAASVFPAQDRSKATKFFRFWLGTTLYSFILTAILAVVVIITSFVGQAGTSAFGAGSIMATIWLGFAPITAVFVVHLIMKNTMGFSPFKPGAALALGAAAGGAGAAAGLGADRLARRGSRALRNGIGQGIGRRAVEGKRYGRGDGKGQKMKPDGAGGKDDKDKLTPEQLKAGKKARAAEGKGLAARLKNPVETTKKSLGRAQVAAGEKLKAAGESLRERPVRSIAKGLGKAAKWGAVGALAVAAPMVTLPAVAGYQAAKHGRRRWKENRETKAVHGMTPQEKKHADAYHAHVATLPAPPTRHKSPTASPPDSPGPKPKPARTPSGAGARQPKPRPTRPAPKNRGGRNRGGYGGSARP